MTTRLSTRLLAAQSDQRLVELSQQGHERAFELLVKRYRKPLLRYSARMGLAPARSEDVVQQALLQAWLAVQRGVEVRDLRAWLYRITHNTAVNAIRRPEVVYPLSDAIDVGAAAATEPEQVLAMRAALGEVAQLPQMQRDAIVLSAIDGRSHEEVASTLGITEGAVRGLLYRARATLRAAVAALTPAPLVAWASGYARNAPAGAGTPGLPELTAAGGAAGVVLKGAAIAVSTVALVAGAAVKLHGSGGHRSPSHAARAPSEAKALSPAAVKAQALAPVDASARGPATGGTPLTRRSVEAPGEAVARLGPSRSSFTSSGGAQPTVTHKPSLAGEAPEWTPASASTPPATVKAAALQTPATGSGGQTPATETAPPTTSPPPATTPPITEGTPPPTEKTDDHETTEKPPVAGEPTKPEPGDDEPSVKKEPLPGETAPVQKDE